jgi:hypothetical protein
MSEGEASAKLTPLDRESDEATFLPNSPRTTKISALSRLNFQGTSSSGASCTRICIAPDPSSVSFLEHRRSKDRRGAVVLQYQGRKSLQGRIAEVAAASLFNIKKLIVDFLPQTPSPPSPALYSQSLPNLASISLPAHTTISRTVAEPSTQRPAKGTATMSAFSSPHGYQTMHSPNGELQLPHHSLPPPPQAYANPYDPQSAAQLQSPSAYSNGHANGHGEGDAQQSIPPPPPASASGGDTQKGNRLRKACDSCSIRKVKV